MSDTIAKYNIINSDCRPALRGMAGESIDLVVTDPPYRIVSGGCSNDKVKIGRYSGGGREYTRQGKLFKHNHIDFSEWLPDVYRALKPGTHCYIMVNARNLKELQLAAEDTGFIFQNLIVWDKGNVTPNKYYLNAHELILMLRKGKARNINNMGDKNILRIPNITRSKLHPTEKPADLMRILVENSTEKNDVVLDPFMGAGSTGVACLQSGRRFIGIEIDENYYSIAADRLSNTPGPVEDLQIKMSFIS